MKQIPLTKYSLMKLIFAIEESLYGAFGGCNRGERLIAYWCVKIKPCWNSFICLLCWDVFYTMVNCKQDPFLISLRNYCTGEPWNTIFPVFISIRPPESFHLSLKSTSTSIVSSSLSSSDGISTTTGA